MTGATDFANHAGMAPITVDCSDIPKFRQGDVITWADAMNRVVLGVVISVDVQTKQIVVRPIRWYERVWLAIKRWVTES